MGTTKIGVNQMSDKKLMQIIAHRRAFSITSTSSPTESITEPPSITSVTLVNHTYISLSPHPSQQTSVPSVPFITALDTMMLPGNTMRCQNQLLANQHIIVSTGTQWRS